MIVKKYKSKVVSIINPIEGIYTIELQSIGKRYNYLPGQFLHLSIDQEYDGIGQWPESRCFSMQSNPDEKNIRITYSVKGSFTKQMMEKLHSGMEIWLKLPYGDLFNQPHSKINTVFIAGGTGITPFISLFTHTSFNEYINPEIYLGFRSREYNIYHDELNQSLNSSKSLKLIYQDTEGVIDIHNIYKLHGVASHYFISGPPEMISLFKDSLTSKGVAEKHILTDDWE